MTQHPLASFVLLAYNQEQYIREAVNGAFAQTYSPLEIILSDDCSPDSTFEIMQQMVAAYDGPHKIVLNRNLKNLGIGRHYNRVMELASGDIVLAAAGDDISLPERTAVSCRILQENPQIMCISLGIHHFKDNPYQDLPNTTGHNEVIQHNINEFVSSVGFHINGAARAFRKYAHDYFGPLNDDCPVEDSPNLFRCLLHGTAAYCKTLGVLYRWHGLNASAPENLRQIRFNLIYKEYHSTILCALQKGLITKEQHALYGTKLADRLQIKEALMAFEEPGTRISVFIKRILFSKYFSMKDKARHMYSMFRLYK